MKLSRRVLELAESATLAVSAKAGKMKAAGVDVVSFGAGEPDFDTPAHVKAVAIDALNKGKTKYPNPAFGLLETREAVCKSLQRDAGLNYKPEEVIITSGGKEAAYLAFHALLDPGDEIVIPDPYWVSYPEMARLAGGVPIHVRGPESSDFKLTPELVRSVMTPRTRIFLINSPSNPSGVTYHPDEIRALATELQKHDIVVISDEIYDRLLYHGQKTLSYAAVSPMAFFQTLTLNSASKTFAMTGWRLGYAAGPVEIIRSMAKLQSQSTSGAATFGQIAYAAALTGDQEPVEKMRQEFERRAEHMWRRLTAMPGIRCPRPTGAFYCFPNVAASYKKLGVLGSIPFAEKLLEQALVAVVPGAAFGMDEHMRLSFATSMEQIDKGLDRIEKFLRGT
ncbi:MAG: pyridoxal phosphate-dependent aminotransferase [Planctomycetes bacterium]|nr:pyridoxal phosphate-dependent aminotransferase [Planctomycetota bacterium]MBI3835531.1 pyridoxal phosphate-dependent aminotransferase [Planctomycetota bacterium]